MEWVELSRRIQLPEEIISRVEAFAANFDFASVAGILLEFRDFERMKEAREQLEARLGEDPDGIKLLACMLKASADLYEWFVDKGISDDIFNATMGCYTRFLRETETMTGRLWFDRGWWTTRQAGGHLFRIGALEYELKQIGEESYVSIHIPSDADFSTTSVEKSLTLAKEMVPRIHPPAVRWEYRCHSWLLDPQLRRMLPEQSNIVCFQKRFEYLTEGEAGQDFAEWLFRVRGCRPEEYPEKTSLQRKVKQHILAGGVIREPRAILREEQKMSKLGFGFLRYPKTDPENDASVDYPLLNRLVDSFLESGGDYFDTAYTYQKGINEEALRKSLVERYPRERYRVADKLPGYMVKSHENCWDFLNKSLERCGLDYFDVYLLHGLNAENYDLAERYDQFGFLEEARVAGKTKKTGFSYHDSPELLERILTAHPEVDYVQLQINYLDWESAVIQARKCYEVAVKHGKPVIVMEPVKGGSLAKLPEAAVECMEKLDPEASCASWAIRFAASLPQVELVLSGMNTMQQLHDNLNAKKPLSETELEMLSHVAEFLRGTIAAPCTACGYCLDGCPKRIAVPRLLALYNEYARSPGESWKMEYLYNDITKERGKAGECVECGQCVRRCPQKLEIPGFLKKLSRVFEGDL